MILLVHYPFTGYKSDVKQERLMRLTLATLTVLALAGCGDSSTSTETTAPTNGTNTATPCAGDTALCDTAPVGPTYMDPVAVGVSHPRRVRR